jgi:hypothetical protein
MSPGMPSVVPASDLLNGQIFRRFVSTSSLPDSYRREQVSRIAYVGVIYTFGGTRKNKDGGFEHEQ